MFGWNIHFCKFASIESKNPQFKFIITCKTVLGRSQFSPNMDNWVNYVKPRNCNSCFFLSEWWIEWWYRTSDTLAYVLYVMKQFGCKYSVNSHVEVRSALKMNISVVSDDNRRADWEVMCCKSFTDTTFCSIYIDRMKFSSFTAPFEAVIVFHSLLQSIWWQYKPFPLGRM